MAAKGQGKGRSKGSERSTWEKENDPPTPLSQETMDPIGTSPAPLSKDGRTRYGHGRPQRSQAAKKLRSEESVFKISAQAQRDFASAQLDIAYAQRDMAARNKKRLRVLEEQSLWSLFSLKMADVDPECREFFALWRARELEKLKQKLVEESEEASWPQRQIPRAAGPPLVDLTSTWQMFSLKVADIDPEYREFFALRRARQLKKFKQKLGQESQEASWPQRQVPRAATPLVDLTSTPDAEVPESKESEARDRDIGEEAVTLVGRP